MKSSSITKSHTVIYLFFTDSINMIRAIQEKQTTIRFSQVQKPTIKNSYFWTITENYRDVTDNEQSML